MCRPYRRPSGVLAAGPGSRNEAGRGAPTAGTDSAGGTPFSVGVGRERGVRSPGRDLVPGE